MGPKANNMADDLLLPLSYQTPCFYKIKKTFLCILSIIQTALDFSEEENMKKNHVKDSTGRSDASAQLIPANLPQPFC